MQKETLKTKVMRWELNHYPVYRRTGAKATYIANDFSKIHIKIPFNRKTKNSVSTIFGGCMYGAVDPIYMLMFMKRLGKGYVVWDKSGVIHHKKPGRTHLYAKFSVDDTQLATIKQALDETPKLNKTFSVSLVDDRNIIHAIIEKTLHFEKK